jgi:hypothetical protein
MDSKQFGTVINDGFDEPVNSLRSGDAKPEDRNIGESGKPETIGGIAVVEPFNFSNTTEFQPVGNESTAGPIPIGTGTRRRGRPPGTRNKTTIAESAQKVSQTLENIEGMLQGIHIAVGAMIQYPAFELSDKEAKAYADAIKMFSAHYPTIVSSKQVATVNLLATVSGIYIPRLMGAYAAKTSNAPAKANVVEMPKPQPQKPASPNTPPATEPKPAAVGTVTNPSQLWDMPPLDEPMF